MVFPEDTPYPDRYGEPQPTGAGPITQWDSNAMFTFILVCVSGGFLLMTYGLILSFLPLIWLVAPSLPIGNLPGIIIMIIFVPVGLIQLYVAWRLYKRTPDTLNLSNIVSIFVIILTGAMFVTEIATVTLSSIEFEIIQIGVNVVLLYLSQLSVVKNHFDGRTDSYYQ